jgi:ABC-type molybdate transport system permease subunit
VTEMRKTVGVVNRCSDVESVHPVNEFHAKAQSESQGADSVFTLLSLRLCVKKILVSSIFSFYKCHGFGACARVGTEAAEHC